MAREINQFRLVFTGISHGPAKTWAEYQVIDDDLKEPPKHTIFKGTNYGKTIGVLWNEKLKAVKEAEKITE